MARGKQLPHIGGEYTAAPEPPGTRELRLAEDVFETYASDPDPRAFWEAMKRVHPKEFAAILLGYASPILARAERAGRAEASKRPLTAISPIRPSIDVDTTK